MPGNKEQTQPLVPKGGNAVQGQPALTGWLGASCSSPVSHNLLQATCLPALGLLGPICCAHMRGASPVSVPGTLLGTAQVRCPGWRS